MGKKRGWLSFVKRMFIQETDSRVEQKSKKWVWVFKRLKFKQYPEIAAPPKTLSEATEEQKKHALTVAIAAAAAAEAAVAAANAAAEVVKLTNLPHEIRRRRRNLAAIKIQSAYRRHLAMKALYALKGLVQLQAVIRGEIVRRKLVSEMKFMTSLVKTEPQMCRIRLPLVDKDLTNGEWRKTLSPMKIWKSEELKLNGNKNMSWDVSLVSKEEMEAMWFRKQEAIIKRERMRKYSYSHRERKGDETLQESATKDNERKSCQISQWNEVEVQERGELERSKSVKHPNAFSAETDKMREMKLISNAGKQDSTEPLNLLFPMPRRSFCHVKQKSVGEVEVLERGEKETSKSAMLPNAFAGINDNMRQLKLISNACKQDSTEPLSSPFSMPRRSFCDVKQKLIGEDFSLPNSPSLPTYMSATESAKAKTRSMSTPKQRLVLSESYSGQHSPYKIRISAWNSFNGELTNTNRKGGISQPIRMNSRESYWD